jgi:hypothetical protein
VRRSCQMAASHVSADGQPRGLGHCELFFGVCLWTLRGHYHDTRHMKDNRKGIIDSSNLQLNSTCDPKTATYLGTPTTHAFPIHPSHLVCTLVCFSMTIRNDIDATHDTSTFNGVNEIPPNVDDYQIPDFPMGTKPKLKIIFMGMGPSGINFTHQLFQRMSDVELVVYEKNVSAPRRLSVSTLC